MRLQQHFIPARMPLGLCWDCCAGFVGDRTLVPSAAIVLVPTIATSPAGNFPAQKAVCGRHFGDDPDGGNGTGPPRRQILVAQGSVPPPPPGSVPRPR